MRNELGDSVLVNAGARVSVGPRDGRAVEVTDDVDVGSGKLRVGELPPAMGVASAVVAVCVFGAETVRSRVPAPIRTLAGVG